MCHLPGGLATYFTCLQVSHVNLVKEPEGENVFVKVRMAELRKCSIFNYSRFVLPIFSVPTRLNTCVY